MVAEIAKLKERNALLKTQADEVDANYDKLKAKLTEANKERDALEMKLDDVCLVRSIQNCL